MMRISRRTEIGLCLSMLAITQLLWVILWDRYSLALGALLASPTQARANLVTLMSITRYVVDGFLICLVVGLLWLLLVDRRRL
jgi:hypothetical protein